MSQGTATNVYSTDARVQCHPHSTKQEHDFSWAVSPSLLRLFRVSGFVMLPFFCAHSSRVRECAGCGSLSRTSLSFSLNPLCVRLSFWFSQPMECIGTVRPSLAHNHFPTWFMNAYACVALFLALTLNQYVTNVCVCVCTVCPFLALKRTPRWFRSVNGMCAVCVRLLPTSALLYGSGV
jgi:hypothetical protein